MAHPANGIADPRPTVEGVAQHLTLVTCFVVFLVFAVLMQALFLPWRQWLPGAEGSRSLVGGVRSAVYSMLSLIP